MRKSNLILVLLLTLIVVGVKSQDISDCLDELLQKDTVITLESGNKVSRSKFYTQEYSMSYWSIDDKVKFFSYENVQNIKTVIPLDNGEESLLVLEAVDKLTRYKQRVNIDPGLEWLISYCSSEQKKTSCFNIVNLPIKFNPEKEWGDVGPYSTTLGGDDLKAINKKEFNCYPRYERECLDLRNSDSAVVLFNPYGKAIYQGEKWNVPMDTMDNVKVYKGRHSVYVKNEIGELGWIYLSDRCITGWGISYRQPTVFNIETLFERFIFIYDIKGIRCFYDMKYGVLIEPIEGYSIKKVDKRIEVYDKGNLVTEILLDGKLNW